MKAVDGVYSVIASAIAGSSIGVIEIKAGRLQGNDNAGSEYDGNAVRNPDGSVSLSVDMTTPPGVFHIWTGTAGDTFQTRNIPLNLPSASFDDGKPFELHGYGVTVIFRRIPEDFASFAGSRGRMMQAKILMDAEEAWQRKRSGG